MNGPYVLEDASYTTLNLVKKIVKFSHSIRSQEVHVVTAGKGSVEL